MRGYGAGVVELALALKQASLLDIGHWSRALNPQVTRPPSTGAGGTPRTDAPSQVITRSIRPRSLAIFAI